MASARPRTAGARLRRLQELADRAGPTLYERARLASELLADHQYIDAKHAGDEGKAADFLQATYFADIGGLLPIQRLVDMVQDVPESRWKELRYDLRAVYAVLEGMRKPDSPDKEKSGGRATLAMLEAEQDRTRAAEKKAQELAYSLKRAEATAETLEQEVARLRGEVAQLREENAELRGRIKELDRVMREVAA